MLSKRKVILTFEHRNFSLLRIYDKMIEENLEGIKNTVILIF